MAVKWSILVPALLLVSLSTYYISTAPQEATMADTLATPTALSAPISPTEADPSPPDAEGADIAPTEEIPSIDSQEAPPLLEEHPPLEEEYVPIEEEETPQEPAPEEEEIPTEEEAPPTEVEEVATNEETPSIQEEEEPPEEANPPVPLDSDIYQLAGSYTSDQGIPVVIQFTDGFYRISLQGLSDSHHTITERTPTGEEEVALTITLVSLPITLELSRTADNTLSVTAYMDGNITPMLSATATKNDTSN